ncbi:SDR family NAD(P)-dependent oxidoreductase [Rhizohabitans arisaemae]|uniref:SDR family NAD(P)-dependent oxidoreductase n=1 Tax=Rhizohabitans arisaemae TaxID=2720610 RepID=UPI0024B03F4F|nr:SDR family NAD(P)-dependent oxidoreductase [Rhizohabitans arisaemae]
MSTTVVITGASGGIGFAVARNLAVQGCRIVLVARDEARGEAARAAVAQLGGPGADLVLGDLSTLAGARAVAESLALRFPRIDVLVHNAGVWPTALTRTADDLETSFVVNHLAPFLINRKLEPLLTSSGTRVVQVSAGLYTRGRVDPDRTAVGADFHPMRTYADTKLCNLLCVPLFAERWKDTGATIDAVHPGVIRTNLGARGGPAGLLLKAVKFLWKSPEQGAEPVARLAMATSGTGRYFDLDRERPLEPVAADTVLARRVWDQAMELTARAG